MKQGANLNFPTRWAGINTTSEQARGLVAFWPASASRGRAGNRLRDVVAGHDMTPSGSPTDANDPVYGVGSTISSGNYLTGSDANLPSGSFERTIAQWVRVDALPTIDRYTFAYGTLAGNQWVAITLFGYGGGDYLKWGISNASTAALAASPLGAAGSVYHLVFTYAGSTSYALYINGDAQTVSGWPGGALGTVLSTASMASYQPLSCTIFDTRVYNRALSSAEVARLYDPRTRWDLYHRPMRVARKAGAGGGGFNPAWVRRQQLVGSGVY